MQQPIIGMEGQAMQSGGKKRRQNRKVGAESATKMIKWWQKAPLHIINKGFKGKIPC